MNVNVFRRPKEDYRDNLRHLFKWRLAIRDSELTSTQKLVALMLTLWMDTDSGKAWPSYTTIAHACSLSRSATFDAVNALCTEGWLYKDGGSKGKSNRYYAEIPPPPYDEPAEIRF